MEKGARKEGVLLFKTFPRRANTDFSFTYFFFFETSPERRDYTKSIIVRSRKDWSEPTGDRWRAAKLCPDLASVGTRKMVGTVIWKTATEVAIYTIYTFPFVERVDLWLFLKIISLWIIKHYSGKIHSTKWCSVVVDIDRAAMRRRICPPLLPTLK